MEKIRSEKYCKDSSPFIYVIIVGSHLTNDTYLYYHVKASNQMITLYEMLRNTLPCLGSITMIKSDQIHKEKHKQS